MEYSNTLTKFGAAPADAEIRAILADVQARLRANGNEEVYRRCFRSIDLTSLGATDSHEHIERFVAKAVRFPGHYPDIENVASVCVYPVFVETAGLVIADSGMTITSVAGGFPSSQTYLEVKMLETAMAVENGADEIDVVISLGEMLSGEYDLMGNEIETLRNEVGDDVVLKVILESGVLARPELIHRAAVIAMEAGADFIKTSTGKAAVHGDPRVRRADGTTGRVQGGRRHFDASGRRALLYDRRADSRPAVADSRSFPHRSELAGWQSAECDRRPRGELFLISAFIRKPLASESGAAKRRRVRCPRR